MDSNTHSAGTVPVKKYVIMFTVLYTALMVVFDVIVTFFELDLGTSASIGILVGASMGVAFKFVSDQNRPPNKTEKRRLVGYCLLYSIVISLVATLLMTWFYAGDQFSDELSTLWNAIPVWGWVIALSIAVLMQYVVLTISFGWSANLYMKQLEKQKQKAQ